MINNNYDLGLNFPTMFLLQDSFRTEPLSTLRVLVMTVGELDFTDFVELYKNQDPYKPLPSVAYTFLFLCLFLLSVGLMNLLASEHPFHVLINKGIMKNVPMFMRGFIKVRLNENFVFLLYVLDSMIKV